MKYLVIEIPSLPPKELSPNWNPFTANAHYVKARKISAYKAQVYACAVKARNEWESLHHLTWTPMQHAILTPTFVKIRLGRNRDNDNAVAMCKSVCDCLTMPISTVKRFKYGAEILQDDSDKRVMWGKPKYKKGPESKLLFEVREVSAEEIQGEPEGI